jgi:putative flippase GtrA
MKEVLFKPVKYCFVGLSGMILDFVTTWFLKERLKVNKYVANSVGFVWQPPQISY